jgi:hypothetical protein
MGKRKAHINTGFISGNFGLHWPSADQMERIEGALGKPVSVEVWAQILHATIYSIMNEETWKQHTPSEEFVSLLQRLKDNVQLLSSELERLPLLHLGPKWIVPTDDGKFTRVPLGEGRRGLLDIVERHFQLEVPEGKYKNELSTYSILEWALDAMLVATEFAIREISRPEHGHYRTGNLWNLWIYMLTVIMKEHGLPYKVSKRTAGKNPFVNFCLSAAEGVHPRAVLSSFAFKRCARKRDMEGETRRGFCGEKISRAISEYVCTGCE